MASLYVPGIYSAGTTRVVQAKLDIQDMIINTDLKHTPIFSTLRHAATVDIRPKVPTDSLNAADLTAQPYAGAAKPANDTARVLVQNYCQRMSETADVGEEQNAIAQYGIPGGEMAYQKPKKLIELKRSNEQVLISDQVMQAPTAANADTGEMNGMSVIIATTTNNVFNQANFDAAMATVVAAGGLPNVAYMDATRKIAVGAWTSNVTRMGYGKDKELEQEVLYYHSDLGERVTMNWHPYMPVSIDGGNDATFMCLDTRYWSIRELLRMQWKDLAYTGGSEAGHWFWNGTILCSAEHANFMFY